MAQDQDHNTRTVLQRGSAILIGIGLLSSFSVYLGHRWFHEEFLPALNISHALGDAVGGFFIILIAYIGQRLVSLAVFRDTQLGTMRIAQELQKANQDIQSELDELDRQASTDKLTGAWNRRRLEEAVKGELDRLARYSHALCLLVFDIDHFKNINDTYGHNAGDRVLVELSQQIRLSLRASDSLTRWGGEEFIVLCPNTALITATMLADRLREKIAAAEFPEVGSVTVSVGVAECQNGEIWEAWFERADAALYRAKEAGRNRVQISPNAPGHVSAGNSIAASFVQLIWHPAYESGREEIDREHRALFSGANDLLAAILSERPGDETQEIIDMLIRDVSAHFAHEEALIAAAGYPGHEAHAVLHRELVRRAHALVDRFHAGSLEIGELFQFLAYDLVSRHLLSADRDFFPYLTPPR